MLRRLIGENVELLVHSAPRPWLVKADAGQLEQVLVNLAVNARDAMPHGGRLTIATGNADLDEARTQGLAGLAPGQYVRLTVTDTGTGMSEGTRARLFEPFFTTKEKGKGTGLGLATCYGIVHQCGGGVFCATELGKGTTFTVYLPRFNGPAAPAELVPEPAVAGGTETLLLVEDDPAVRAIAARVLTAKGYRVLEAENGLAALEVAERRACKIDLLVTDVVMPQMGGKELVERLRAMLPELRVLFTSGYTADESIQQGDLGHGTTLLQKPFTASVLAQRIREALAG
jgi:CheY-like chemotaxis protein